MGSPHRVLGIEPSATAEEVDAAYRRMVKQTHPDTGGSPGLFEAVQQAYEQLAATSSSPSSEGEAAAPPPPPSPGPGRHAWTVGGARPVSVARRWSARRRRLFARLLAVVAVSLPFRLAGVGALLTGAEEGRPLLGIYRWGGPPTFDGVGFRLVMEVAVLWGLVALAVAWFVSALAERLAEVPLPRPMLAVFGGWVVALLLAGEFLLSATWQVVATAVGFAALWWAAARR